MSIFLLVSIGSVCASDDAMDADIISEDNNTAPVSDSTPIKTTIESKNIIVNKTDTQKIPVTVKDDKSQKINITKGDLNVTENKKVLKFNYVNSSITLTDKLAAGNHSILIKYLGNANYSISSKTIKLSVIGDKDLNVASSINVNATENVVIPIKLTDSVNEYGMDKNNLGLTISYKEGNKTINKTISAFELSDNSIKFKYDLNVTTCNATITYIDNNKTLTKNVVLKRVNSAKIIPLNLTAEYASGTFTFKLVDQDTNETLSGKKLSYTIITGTINTGGSVTTDAKGIATIDNSNLNILKYENGTISNIGHIPVGKQLFSIKGDDSSISAPEIKDNFTITKVSINIVINPYKEAYGSDKKVIINVTNAKTSTAMKGIILHLNIPSTKSKDYYYSTDANGTLQINVSTLTAGTYAMTVNNNDTVNINKKSVDGSITIGKQVKMSLTVPKTYYYNSGNIATIKITDKITGKAVPNAIVLLYVYTGKKPQAYLYQANSKGIINVNYSPAAVGSHKITALIADQKYYGDSVSKTVTVKKASAKITSAKVKAYYKGGKNLVIKLSNTKNKKGIYAAKLNIKIFISSTRYYNYNGQTGLDGKLRISLDTFKPGTYKVVISKGESKNFTASKKTTSFTIKKAPTKLYPKKLTAKKGVKKYFKVTVKNTKTKKVIKGVKVKIKVYTGKKYKTYTVKTNSKGIANLNVKSLKVGSHKVVVSSANKYCVAKTAKSTIKITKK